MMRDLPAPYDEALLLTEVEGLRAPLRIGELPEDIV